MTEALHREVDRVLRLYAERCELAAENRHEAADAVARGVIQNFVATRQVIRVTAPLEQRVSNAGPCAQRPPLARLRQRVRSGLDDIRHFVAGNLEVYEGWVAVIIVVSGA